MLFHWTWRQLYESMIVVQSGMIVGSFLIAVRLSKRYMAELNWLVRDFACLAVFVYPTYIVYAHVTWTETTLLFTFWIFLYTMMRMTDKPSVKNHIGFALIAFYIFYGASAVPWHRHRGGDDRGRYAAGKEEHADTDCLFPAGSPVQQLCAFDHQGQAAK